MRRYQITIIFTIIVLCILTVPSAYAAVPAYVAGQTGVDISWPESNCRVPTRFLRSWAIVGVNDGLDLTKNPCLRSEAARVSSYSLYANTGYPDNEIGHRYTTSPLRITLLVLRMTMGMPTGYIP
jgi:hypothetical protein